MLACPLRARFSSFIIGTGGGGGGFLVGFGGFCFFCLSRNCSGGSIIRSL